MMGKARWYFPIEKTEIFIFNYFNMLGQKDGFSRKNLVKISTIISGTYLLTIWIYWIKKLLHCVWFFGFLSLPTGTFPDGDKVTALSAFFLLSFIDKGEKIFQKLWKKFLTIFPPFETRDLSRGTTSKGDEPC